MSMTRLVVPPDEPVSMSSCTNSTSAGSSTAAFKPDGSPTSIDNGLGSPGSEVGGEAESGECLGVEEGMKLGDSGAA